MQQTISNYEGEAAGAKIAIIGGGSWATALAKIVMCNKMHISWYMRRQSLIDEFMLKGRNPNYLSAAHFDTSRITFSTDINQIVCDNDILIIAIPSPFIKQTLSKLRFSIRKKIVVSAVKGMVADANMVMSDYLHQKYKVPMENICIVTGPCHAEEVALERLSYLTIGSKNRDLAMRIAPLFKTNYMHTTLSPDVDGLEYASVMKNIYAIAAGVCNGLRFGDNFQAVLISNAIQEMQDFIKAVSPLERDVKQSAYLGDLMVTAYSNFSRNRQFGYMIGMGYSIKAAQLEMEMVAEGYYASYRIHEQNKKYGIKLPIADAVYHILYEHATPLTEIAELTKQLL